MGKRILSVSICFLLVLSLVSGALPRVQAAQLDGLNLSLTVDGRDPVTVKAYQSSYGNNLLLSLRDVAAAVTDTAKSFDIFSAILSSPSMNTIYSFFAPDDIGRYVYPPDTTISVEYVSSSRTPCLISPIFTSSEHAMITPFSSITPITLSTAAFI